MGRWASTARAACGLLGPAAFTAAWIVGTQRQPVYSIANEHISGLAAPDAEAPHVMTAGFAALGVSTIVFASELDRRLHDHRSTGTTLMALSGVAMLAAGVFRRDRISNYPLPGQPDQRQSWRNDVHDLSAVLAGSSGIAALLALAGTFARDPRYRDLALPSAVAAVTSAGLSAWFVRDVVRPGNGVVQRVSVSIPLVAMGALAWRLLRRPGTTR